MRRAFHIAWALLVLGLLAGYPLLPERVGDPGKETSRAAFAGTMVFLSLHAWLCSHHFILWLGRRSPGLINLPHRDYWLAPERREASLQRLGTHLSGLGLLLTLLVGGLYGWQIADEQWGPLPGWLGWSGAGGLGLLFLVWLRLQFRLFPAPPASVQPTSVRRPARPPVPDRYRRGQP